MYNGNLHKYSIQKYLFCQLGKYRNHQLNFGESLHYYSQCNGLMMLYK